jgi:hypothetical protein
MAHEITVTPTQQVDGNIAWTLCYEKQCGGPAQGTKYPAIIVPADGQSHDFKVTIGQPDLGIIYDQDALWMAPGKGVKPKKGLDNHHQINGFTVDSNGKVLTFTDDNSNMFPKWFSYQLNFRQGDKKVVLDPDWKNGGGGFGLYFKSVEAAAVTILAAVILVALGAWIGRLTLRRKLANTGKAG